MTKEKKETNKNREFAEGLASMLLRAVGGVPSEKKYNEEEDILKVSFKIGNSSINIIRRPSDTYKKRTKMMEKLLLI